MKVIFRKFTDGNIIALFPELVGDSNPYATCNSYMHIGQHGAASVYPIVGTRPVKNPQEYTDLLAELVSIGYSDLRIAKRFTRADLNARKRALDEMQS